MSNLHESIELYQSGLSLEKVSNKLGIRREKVTQYLRDNGVTIRKGNKRHIIDESYFKEIDSEAKAYWLGFIAADGSIYKCKSGSNYIHNVFELSLSSKDREHISKFIEAIKGNTNKIYDYTTKLNGKKFPCSQIVLSHKEFCINLIEHGIAPKKTTTVSMPTYLPQHLIRHYIRGVFDGDGHISPTTRMINITGNGFMLNDIDEYFEDNLGVPSPKYYPNGKVFECFWYGTNALKILEHLYSDCTVYLDRKYEIALAHLR